MSMSMEPGCEVRRWRLEGAFDGSELSEKEMLSYCFVSTLLRIRGLWIHGLGAIRGVDGFTLRQVFYEACSTEVSYHLESSGAESRTDASVGACNVFMRNV
jgi:hypothetical protein